MKPSPVLVFVLFGCLGTALQAQSTLANDDVPKLVREGLSEEFILNLIDKQGSKLSSDVIVRLARAGFSEGFILDLLSWQPVRVTMDASRIVELKQAGVSERILAAMIAKTNRKLPSGTEIKIRPIDSIDSEKNDEGDEFRASLDIPIRLDDTEVVPRGADARVGLVNEKESGKLTGRTELSVRPLSFTVDGNPVRVNTTIVREDSSLRYARTAKCAAAAGAGSQVFMKGQRVRIPSETVLTFTARETVNLP